MNNESTDNRIIKSQGVTKSERYLARLGEKLFLSLWSYPSVFRDQGKIGSGDGKEVCDLLVVFQNNIIIFSDKSCSYPNTGVEQRDWCRWFRKSVFDSAKQVWGAERWIREYPNRLFLDRGCKHPFPIKLPATSEMVIHRVVVARTAKSRCRKYFKGGSGSLIISPSIHGSLHCANENLVEPFRIGDIDTSKGFIHVFDEIGLLAVMSELDTTPDLVDYLNKREKFLRSGKCLSAAGEEELLAYYLHHLDSQEENDFVIPTNISKASFLEGLWEEYIASDRRMRRIDADEISYSWDKLIEKFNYHIINGSSIRLDGFPQSTSDRGEAVRMLAATSRTSRRLLAKSLLEHVLNSKATARSARVHLPVKEGYPHFVFLAISDIHSKSYNEYREFRSKLLEAFCMVVKLKYPDAMDIVGIATEPGSIIDRSEDVIWLDARNWSTECQAEAESLQRNLGLLTQCGPQVSGKEYQFPASKSPRTSKRKTTSGKTSQSMRNSSCPCGSGKKWKKCCKR